MRIFFDFEFIEGGSAFVMEPISLGMVREDGAEFYYEWWNVDWSKANQWVLDNVKPYLTGISIGTDEWCNNDDVVKFCGEKPEFWAYYADYDWVLLCQLFGRMIDLPESWPMWCRDLKQYMWHYGISKGDLPEHLQREHPHNALEDARWNKEVFDWMRSECDPLVNP